MARREEIRLPEVGAPISHYTDAVIAGDLLFVSGIVPVDPEGNLVGGDDVAAQTRQVFAIMERVLSAAGATFADVVKVTVYLTDVDDRPRINPVRQEVFGETRPASTLIEISRLAIPGAKVEIDAVALLPGLTLFAFARPCRSPRRAERLPIVPHVPTGVASGPTPVAPPRERAADRAGSGTDDAWKVVVLNDNHNTFEGVAFALAAVLPGVSYEDGLRLADRIHREGRAVVWSGQKEQAERYWQQLRTFGLTMAALHR